LPLPPFLPAFSPGTQLTQDRFDHLNINKYGYLLPEEEKLVTWILCRHDYALLWEETEIGHFRSNYFNPVVFPTIEHTPWQDKNIPILPTLLDSVIATI
jgi:hypothetical protein